MYDLCIETNKSYVYGFLGSYNIQYSGIQSREIQTYIQNQLVHSNKVRYLTLFIYP